MTAQINDTVSFKDKEFNLVGISGADLFDPSKHGFTPRYISSALGRGYYVGYRIDNNQLTLSKLTMTLFNDDQAEQLFSVDPQRAADDRCDWTWCTYDKLSAPIKFSGDIMIASGFIDQLDDNMGFHPAWKYKSVLELSLANGAVTRVLDRSDMVERIREKSTRKSLRPGTNASHNEIMDWIKQTFSREFCCFAHLE